MFESYTYLVQFAHHAYPGPETMLPLASIIAAVVGVILMFGRLMIGTVRRSVRRILGKGEPETPASESEDKAPPP